MADATATTGTAPGVEQIPDTPGGAWQHAFPQVDMVDVAAGMLPSQPAGHGQEGPDWRITISPGKIQVWTRDEARAERTANRQAVARQQSVDAQVSWLANGEEVPQAAASNPITEWSWRSRTRMFERLNDLDYSPLVGDPARLPGMVTFTYPRCWQRVAPNGETVKQKHLKALRKRYERAFGEPLRCIWKLEFQGRSRYVWQDGEQIDNWCSCDWCAELEDGRAPHIHMLMSPPLHAAKEDPTERDPELPPRYFWQWVRETWADIVAHPDPVEYARHKNAGTRVDINEGLRCTDPRRVAVYFLKHGSGKAKEYQHWVPAAWQLPGNGPGRFWGYWGLDKVTATQATSPQTGQRAGRLLRRYSKAQGTTHVTPANESHDGKPHEHREKVTHERRKPRTKRGAPISKYPEVFGFGGALLQSRHTTYRKTRSPAVRLKNGRGWLSLNDAPELGWKLALWLQEEQRRDHREADQTERDRCGITTSPLARALRLKPGPKRDEIVAHFRSSE